LGRIERTLPPGQAVSKSGPTSQKAGKSVEEKLSLAFLNKAKSHRLGALDGELAVMREGFQRDG